MKIIKSSATQSVTITGFNNCKDFDTEDVYKISGSIVAMFNHSELPVPWDAGFEIKVKDLIIEGSAASSGYGYSKMVFPKTDYKRYDLSFVFQDGNIDKLTKFLLEKNVQFVIE
jgi:hypothetical protein